MTETENATTYGLLISKHNRFGREHVRAVMVKRRKGDDHPLNCDSRGEPGYEPARKFHAGRLYAGLQIEGFFSDSADRAFIGYEVEYREPISVDLPQALKMAHTLRHAVTAAHKASANEPGDYLYAVAKALKLEFCVMQRGTSGGSNYSDSSWSWLTIEQGRNEFRRLISETRAALSGQTKAA